MLRVIQTKSAEGAKSYYSRSDYLSEGQELVGRWGGKGASMLGLSGEVDKQSFDQLCDNIDPRNGNRLTLRTNTDRTVGYDFNFHAPKGVSLAYLVNGDERILPAFQLSVDETMQEIEQDVATRIRKYGLMDERPTRNLVYGGFDHFTTREVDGEPDPHLHSHRLVFNVTWDNKEQAWKAIQFRELKRDASYYEAAFHARLAGRMRELGYDIRRKGKDWDLDGFAQETLAKFSRRTKQIESMAAELGIEDAKQKDALGAKSRVKKTYGTSLVELKEAWRHRLDPAETDGFRSFDILWPKSRELVIEPDRERDAMSFAKLHCFERDSVVPKRKVLTEGLRQGLGYVSVDGMHRQMEEQRIIWRNMHGRDWATTPEVLVEEGAMLAMAKAGKEKSEPLNQAWQISRDWLNTDQKRAVEHVLQSKDKYMIIKGGAGTGKTSLMKEAVEGINAGGHQVFTFAPSAEASRGVLAKEGFQATTVAELLVNKGLQQETAGQVIWIDEAGLLGTRTLKQVMDLAERDGSRLILSGDWRQHGSVERGAAMRLLEQHAGIKPVEVSKIQRQTGLYRDAVANLAKGATEAGYAKLEELGWVHEIDDPTERYQLMAEKFAEGLNNGESVLAIAPTHVEGEMLSSHIRNELKARGLVQNQDQEFERLEPLRLTEAEKTDPERVAQGDVILFHRRSKGFKKGDRLDAKSLLEMSNKPDAKDFEVYRRRSLLLAEGDFVRITANGKTKDGKHRLNNGSIYRVRSFTDSGDIQLNNNWIVSNDYSFLSPGYVSTSHAAQGKTVDRVLIAESAMSYGAAGREQFYVSVSRGKQQAEIFTDDKEILRDAISKEDKRISATDLLGEPISRRMERQVRLEGAIKQTSEPTFEKGRELEYDRV